MALGLRTVLEASLFVVAGIVGADSLAASATPAPAVQQGAADDFRAAYATPQDIAEGKRVADASCGACHGSSGISTTKGVPHLAGQRAVYLHIALKAYKSGARGKGVMADAVRFLSDDALIKVAAWYANLDPAQPAPAATGSSIPAAPDPVIAGKAAAASCAGCHGESGISKIPGMPNLVGLDPQYLAGTLNGYKNGKRKNDTMKAMVAGLGDADVNNIAVFYATQKAGRAQTQAAGNPASGKAAAASCDACHGAAGAGSATAPGLAGQDAQYLNAALRAYKDGSRPDPIMKGQATSIGDSVAADLAAYYAAQQPRQPQVNKTLSIADWSQRCDRCHGVNGNSTDPRLPALAAQRADYLEVILNAYRTNARKSHAMSAMSQVLTEVDVGLLADHYAGQKARAVVYVQLPARN